MSTVQYLVVAGGGGGGGGYEGGGGGAGGYLASASHTVTSQTYGITVGAGGAGVVQGSPDVVAANGVNSVFDTATAIGGGRGGSESPNATPNTGGSGGGGSWDGSTQNVGAAGTAGPPIQGYKGGDGKVFFPYGNDNFPGGGGGGSSGAGTDGVNTIAQTDGGPGTSNSISGGAVTYAAGGKGANRGRNANGSNASANTGNGGEAGGKPDGSASGGNGGSGIVIISYVTADFGTCSVTGTGNAITTSGSDSIATFIVSGNFVCVTGGSGPANLKSYNTNLKANIKTINTNAIANVKTLNTNA